MDLLYETCAGLDVHQKSVTACIRKEHSRGQVERQTRTFLTTTAELVALSEWLAEQGCSRIVMEATGVYWKPVWNVLCDSCQLTLANAQHVRAVPGRKSDVKDAEWLAELLAHGLVRASFVPDRPTQELRDLTRTYRQLKRERAQHMNRIHKVLEDANIKLGTVVSDILGVSGRAILAALVAGESDPQRLADATTGRLQAKPEEIRQALRGHVREHHRFLLRTHLTMIDAVDEQVATLEARIDRASAPLEEAVSRLDGVPGISRSSAHAILAEIGHDMTRFPTAAHLVSFAGLCPRLAESAGKKKSTKTRKGSTWLKTVLVSCAWGAVRTKNTYARAQYHRLKSRRGPKKAIVAVAASLLTAVYYMLRANTPYRDLGANYFDRQSPHQAARRLCRRLEALGFTVNITPQAAATA